MSNAQDDRCKHARLAQVSFGTGPDLDDGLAEGDDDDRPVPVDEVAGQHAKSADSDNERAAEVDQRGEDPHQLPVRRVEERGDQDEAGSGQQTGHQMHGRRPLLAALPCLENQEHQMHEPHTQEGHRENQSPMGERIG